MESESSEWRGTQEDGGLKRRVKSSGSKSSSSVKKSRSWSDRSM